MAEWLERLSLVLKGPGSKRGLHKGFFKNSWHLSLWPDGATFLCELIWGHLLLLVFGEELSHPDCHHLLICCNWQFTIDAHSLYNSVYIEIL